MCEINWPAFFSTLKDVVLALAAVLTAAVAWLGLHRWRQELRGKADFEVARGLARAAYKLREEIQKCRSPLMRYAVPEGDRGTTQRGKAEAQARVYQERWDRVSSALQEFDAQTLEAEALWGADILTNTHALRECATTLYVSIEAIIEDMMADGEQFSADPQFAILMRSNAHAASSATDNALSNQIAKALTALDAKIRPHLARPK